MLIRPLRLVLPERPRCGYQMARHQVGQLPRKRAQLVADLLVQFLGGDVGRERRKGLSAALRLRGGFLPRVRSAVTLVAPETAALASRPLSAVIPIVTAEPAATRPFLITFPEGTPAAIIPFAVRAFVPPLPPPSVRPAALAVAPAEPTVITVTTEPAKWISTTTPLTATPGSAVVPAGSPSPVVVSEPAAVAPA